MSRIYLYTGWPLKVEGVGSSSLLCQQVTIAVTVHTLDELIYPRLGVQAQKKVIIGTASVYLYL